MFTLASNEIPLDPEKGPGYLVHHYKDLTDEMRSNYADKVNLPLFPDLATKTQQAKKPSFLLANFIRHLERKYYNLFSIIALSPQFSALLIFILFMKISSHISIFKGW